MGLLQFDFIDKFNNIRQQFKIGVLKHVRMLVLSCAKIVTFFIDYYADITISKSLSCFNPCRAKRFA